MLAFSAYTVSPTIGIAGARYKPHHSPPRARKPHSGSGRKAPQLGAGAGVQRIHVDCVIGADIHHPIRHGGRGSTSVLQWQSSTAGRPCWRSARIRCRRPSRNKRPHSPLRVRNELKSPEPAPMGFFHFSLQAANIVDAKHRLIRIPALHVISVELRPVCRRGRGGCWSWKHHRTSERAQTGWLWPASATAARSQASSPQF